MSWNLFSTLLWHACCIFLRRLLGLLEGKLKIVVEYSGGSSDHGSGATTSHEDSCKAGGGSNFESCKNIVGGYTERYSDGSFASAERYGDGGAGDAERYSANGSEIFTTSNGGHDDYTDDHSVEKPATVLGAHFSG
ncbi:hypothetical protein OIU77_007382 [Salix suchowensis]|uniref:Uncharacterized protein n=1 Tax=Salix suchowensis TaxID=1278906 RepID=A0ABQ9AFV9_9ROSI|nr:hypothetical protein OIU77_007382 [Salix suchowensis]